MIAVKGNKEVKILEMQKEAYLEKGYKILDEDLKVIASPSTKEEKINRLEEENKKLEKKVKDLEKKIKELDKQEK